MHISIEYAEPILWEINKGHPLFAAHADDYLQLAPAAAVYGLHIAGIRGKHNLADAAGIYL